MSKKILSLGLKRRYKPYNDERNIDLPHGKEVILLECRKPATIIDGWLHGAEIDLYGSDTVRVWTSQKHKAMAIAKANGFRVRPLDGEAELFIPVARADEFLHGLGAKVRATRIMTPEQRDAARIRLMKVHQARKAGSEPAPSL